MGRGGDVEGAAQRQPGRGAPAPIPRRALRRFPSGRSVPPAPASGSPGRAGTRPSLSCRPTAAAPSGRREAAASTPSTAPRWPAVSPTCGERGVEEAAAAAGGAPLPVAFTARDLAVTRCRAVTPPPPAAGYAAEQSSLSSLDCLSSIVDRLSPAEEPGLPLRDADSLSPSASIDSGPGTPGTPPPRRTYQAL